MMPPTDCDTDEKKLIQLILFTFHYWQSGGRYKIHVSSCNLGLMYENELLYFDSDI